MALLTVSKESALAEAGNSVYTASVFHGLAANFGFCACLLHVSRHSTLERLAQKAGYKQLQLRPISWHCLPWAKNQRLRKQWILCIGQAYWEYCHQWSFQLGFRWFLRCLTQEGGGVWRAQFSKSQVWRLILVLIIVLLVLSLSGHFNCSSSVV